MTYDSFSTIAKQDMFRALWIAKYYGVTMTVVKAWTAAVMNTMKK